MTLLLARIPALRLLRTPRGWLPIVAWTLLAIVIALSARARGATTGSDHVMRGTFAFLVLPLLAYGVVGATLGGSGLRGGIRGVVALGAAPRSAALASVLVAITTSAALCGVLGALVSALAHGSQDPPLALDMATSLGVAALGGATYAAYFSAGAAIGKGTMMRGLFLAFDWIVGGGAGAGALITPRGHVTALLGGPLAADLSLRTSSVMLVVLLVVYASLAVLLVRRA